MKTLEGYMNRMYLKLIEDLSLFAVESSIDADTVVRLFLDEMVLTDKIDDVLLWSSIKEDITDEIPSHLPIGRE